jgi:hypothetical protein
LFAVGFFDDFEAQHLRIKLFAFVVILAAGKYSYVVYAGNVEHGVMVLVPV